MAEITVPQKPERRALLRRRRRGAVLPGKPARRQSPDQGFGRFENPATGTRIAGRLTLFHDAADGNFACTIGAQPWIRLTAYQFQGSYISIAIGLRKADLKQVRLGTRMDVRLDAVATRPLPLFMRLNMRDTERTETQFETLVLNNDPNVTSFAVDGMRLSLSDLESGWLDLIFSEPAMCEIDIRELAVSFHDVGTARA